MSSSSTSPTSLFSNRNWNTNDFTGKYHKSTIREKNNPIGGTQVKLEQDYEKQRNLAYKKIEDDNANAAIKLQHLLKIKAQGIEFKTKVDFDNSVYLLISDTENVLNEKQKLKDSEFVVEDDMSTVNKFLSNMALGRHYFVGYSISSGFRSINFQHPESGNTALHLAVKNGHPEAVEELLKYKADPDIKNKLGYLPIHEAWQFWKKKHDGERYRTKEEREKQEETTFVILKHIVSYKGFVDAQDIHGNTALHIACRLGPTKAVKMLLGFKADYEILNKAGQLPIDVAEEHNKHESMRMLQSWAVIRKQLIHVDFSMVWHTFLADSEAVISNSKPADAIITEINMDENLHKLERDGKNVLSIDDPLLRQVYYENRDFALTDKLPLPWEAGWGDFTQQLKDKKTLELQQRIEELTMKLNHSQSTPATSTTAVTTKSAGHYPILPITPSSTSNNMSHLLESPLNVVHMSKRARRSWASHQPKDKTSSGRNLPERRMQRIDDDDEDLAQVTSDTLEASSPAVGSGYLSQRRLRAAHGVALDAKFLPFTSRLSTSSALLLPLRKPQAPLVETEEEHSVLRAITSQGKDFDIFEKYKKVDRKAELMGLSKKPVVSVMGSYCKPVETMEPSERDRMFATVATAVSHVRSEAASSSSSSSAVNSSIINKYEPEKKEPLELVAGASRPRYVRTDILPPKHVVTVMEQMWKDKQQRDQDSYFRRQGLSDSGSNDAARAHMEEMILHSLQGEEQATESNSTYSSGSSGMLSEDKQVKADLKEKERELAMAKRFLDKPAVKYGANRLTSTHNSRGKLEEPWTTVGGRYATLAGDRTT